MYFHRKSLSNSSSFPDNNPTTYLYSSRDSDTFSKRNLEQNFQYYKFFIHFRNTHHLKEFFNATLIMHDRDFECKRPFDSTLLCNLNVPILLLCHINDFPNPTLKPFRAFNLILREITILVRI